MMKKRWKLILKIVVGFLVIHLLADAIYAWYIARSVAAWEVTIERDENGVMQDCDAFLLPANPETDTGVGIVLLHGINASPRHYDFVAVELAERGFTCRAMRLPGFAEPLTQYRKSSYPQWIAAVHNELSELRKTHDRVGIVGHSLGGATTIGALLEKPELADFCVLLAPAVKVSDSRSPLLSTRSWHEISQRTLFFVDTVSSPYGMDCRDETKQSHPGQTLFTPTVVVDQLFQLMDENESRFADWEVPVTMVVSAGDVVVSTPAVKSFFEQIDTDDKKLVVLENTGHELPLDLQWQEVVDLVVERAVPQDASEEATAE